MTQRVLAQAVVFMEMVDLMEVGYETLWWEKEGGGKFDFKILMAK